MCQWSQTPGPQTAAETWLIRCTTSFICYLKTKNVLIWKMTLFSLLLLSDTWLLLYNPNPDRRLSACSPWDLSSQLCPSTASSQRACPLPVIWPVFAWFCFYLWLRETFAKEAIMQMDREAGRSRVAVRNRNDYERVLGALMCLGMLEAASDNWMEAQTFKNDQLRSGPSHLALLWQMH